MLYDYVSDDVGDNGNDNVSDDCRVLSPNDQWKLRMPFYVVTFWK